MPPKSDKKRAKREDALEAGAAKRPKKTAKEMKEHAKALKASGDFKPKEKKPPAKKSEKKKSEKKDKKRKSDSGGSGDGGQQPAAKKKKVAVADDKSLLFPVLVRGLGEVSVADLQDVFSECGATHSVKISGQGKAIVTFADRDAAAMAIKLHGTEMDGSVIKVSKLSPTEFTALPTPAGPVSTEPDDGFSLSVCINQVPEEATIEEIQLACEAYGEVAKVKRDKKRQNVAYCEFVSKVSARLATKRSVKLGRVLCKTVHLQASSIETDESRAAAAAALLVPVVEKVEKGPSLTILAKGFSEGVTDTQIRDYFNSCGEAADVRIGASQGMILVFVDFPSKTSFRKAMRLKNPKFQGKALHISVARNVTEKSTVSKHESTSNRPRPPSCRTIIVKNLAYGSPDETEQKTKSKIARVFKVCGTVKEVRLFMDRGTETFKGMCFVEFAEAEALNAALQMHGRDNDGRPMKIDWSDNKEVAVKKKYGANATMNPR
eukprot:CAMPEP_0173089096 /NCGR_PEP_ID=MMETSP1102-20130122/25583_1 /TAXON_ID=49646 /ORGANISM="Geminigera sp., Strain Caron Lab Isolate" /LENGTH=490 /DNA_ID=CAMNT_0013972639 /DNA_START=8 /DNA_END=1477 /DNA_ORIENTATION=-